MIKATDLLQCSETDIDFLKITTIGDGWFGLFNGILTIRGYSSWHIPLTGKSYITAILKIRVNHSCVMFRLSQHDNVPMYSTFSAVFGETQDCASAAPSIFTRTPSSL